jgi:hypothetical protein
MGSPGTSIRPNVGSRSLDLPSLSLSDHNGSVELSGPPKAPPVRGLDIVLMGRIVSSCGIDKALMSLCAALICGLEPPPRVAFRKQPNDEEAAHAGHRWINW